MGYIGDLPRYQEDLSLDQLIIDERYQRPIVANMVSKIAKDWDPRQLGVIMVSLREDGQCAVIDGQHRVAALKRRGYDTVPCLVIEGLTVGEEAGLFAHLNQNRRAPSAWDKFHARLCAGDPEAIDIRKICEEVGYGVGPFPSSHNIQAVGALQDVYRLCLSDREDTCGLALRWSLRAWKSWYPDEAPRGAFLRALGLMYRQREGKLDLQRFQTRVASQDHTVYTRQARLDTEGLNSGTNSVSYWLAKRMLLRYDKRRKTAASTTAAVTGTSSLSVREIA